MRAHPQLDIELRVIDRTVSLVEECVDCVLRVGDSGLISRKIGDLPLINVASPGYLFNRGTPGVPDVLAAHLAFTYASPATGRVEDWEWIDGGETHTLPMRCRVTVNSAEAYIACCLAGLIQIPAYDVKRHLDARELVEVMPDHRAAPMPMPLLYPHR